MRGHYGTAQIKNLWQKFWLNVPTPYSSVFRPLVCSVERTIAIISVSKDGNVDVYWTDGSVFFFFHFPSPFYVQMYMYVCGYNIGLVWLVQQ